MESQLARADVAAQTALRAGWIGAGKMGAPMARHLLAAGHPVAIVEPDPETRDALQQAGATVSADLSAIGGCDVVFATLPTMPSCAPWSSARTLSPASQPISRRAAPSLR